MWWSKAASYGNDPSSIRARHTLGLYYSRGESTHLSQVRKEVWAHVALVLHYSVNQWCSLQSGWSGFNLTTFPDQSSLLLSLCKFCDFYSENFSKDDLEAELILPKGLLSLLVF